MIERDKLRGWLEKEVTDPKHMEASLRYAAILPTDFLGMGAFTFPWYKPINGENYMLHFRRSGQNTWQNFSLDLGQFTGERFNEWPIFKSLSWHDFEVTRRHIGSSRSHLIGKGSREEETNNLNPVYVKRVSYTKRHPIGYWGVYVAPEIRRNGVGSSLVSAARIILSQIGASVLVLNEISEIKEGKPRRYFYDSLGGRFFDVYEDRYRYTWEKVLCGKVAYPTRETERCSYRFE